MRLWQQFTDDCLILLLVARLVLAEKFNTVPQNIKM